MQSAGEYENSLEKKGVAGDGVLILLPGQVYSSDTLWPLSLIIRALSTVLLPWCRCKQVIGNIYSYFHNSVFFLPLSVNVPNARLGEEPVMKKHLLIIYEHTTQAQTCMISHFWKTVLKFVRRSKVTFLSWLEVTSLLLSTFAFWCVSTGYDPHVGQPRFSTGFFINKTDAKKDWKKTHTELISPFPSHGLACEVRPRAWRFTWSGN